MIRNRSMKVLVCGGRDFKDRSRLFTEMDRWLAHYPKMTLCSGGARGADHIATVWARVNNIPIKVFKANWRKYGRSAGPIRNQHMLDFFKPRLVIAFPGGPGTADMVQRAIDEHVEVIQP